MVIDTSGLLAILNYEPEAAQFAAAIQNTSTRLISAATLLECAIVIEARYGEPGEKKLDEMHERIKKNWHLEPHHQDKP